MGFDAQVTAYLDRMAALGAPPNAELTPTVARRQTEEMAGANFGPVEDVRAVTDTEIAGVPVRSYDPRPAALQLLVYPVTDCAMDTGSYRRCATGCGMSAKDMAWYWHHYMGQRDRTDPDASPLRAASLAGVAPAHVVVCENDVLHDEGIAYAERLKADGVPVTLRDVDGMIHGYIRMSAHFDRSRELWDDCAAALGKAFGAD